MATIEFDFFNFDTDNDGTIDQSSAAAGNGFELDDGVAGENDLTAGVSVVTITSLSAGGQTFTATYEGLTVETGEPVFTITDSPGGVFDGATAVLSASDLDTQTFTTNPVDFTVCFAAGTLIATPAGETAVEELRIGDPILTADGRTVPVKWIGRQTVQKFFTPADSFAPVRITAGALGDGLPHTDLRVTACHGLVIDGVLINAGAMVNGTTILRERKAELPDRMTYWHVETEDHDVIVANGAPAETFISKASRERFDNHDEYLALYGDVADRPELEMPRVSVARLVPGFIRARLDGKSAA